MIDTTGDNHDGANALGSISKEFNSYILSHLKIQALIDPVYIIIDLPSVGNLNPPANIANYPLVNSPHALPKLFLPSTYIYTFGGRSASENAQHFIG